MKSLLALVIFLLVSIAPSLPCQETWAFTGARIHTAAGKPIENGVLLIRAGKILAVGPASKVRVQRGMRLFDMKGRVIVPGLVDTHSHLGVYPRPGVPANSDGNEMTGPVQAIVRAIDSIHPGDPAIRMALAGGITTANIMPGSGNVIGGQTAYVKLRGHTVEDMLLTIEKGPGKGLHGGLKMANGENPKRAYGSRGKSPVTRMALQALQRAHYTMARNYRAKWRRYREAVANGDEEAIPPERDLRLEPLVEVLDGKRIAHHHTHRADDILRAAAMAKEFGFRIVLHHVSEGYKVVQELAKLGVPCSVIIIDSPGGKLEAADYDLRCAGDLEKAGVPVSIHTDDPITSSRFFLRSAALAVRAGMSREGALRALSIEGARMMDLDDQVGSLEPGKDADFVILSGDPFALETKVLQTWIDGKKVWDLTRFRDRRFLTGGFGVADRYVEPTLSVEAAPKRQPPIVGGVATKVIIRAKTLHTAGPLGSFDNALIMIEDGKIQAVGKEGALEIPKGTRVLQAEVVTPGLIDAHGVAGLTGIYNVRADQDHDESSGPVQASLRATDGFNPKERLLAYLLSFGITTVHSGPSPSNPIAGQSGVFKTFGHNVDECTLRFPAAMQFTLGERPKAVYGEKHLSPSTRMGTAAVIRRALNRAREYGLALARFEKSGKGNRPAFDANLEALLPVLSGDLPAMFTAHREDDILTAIRLAKEFGLHAILDSATEAYLVRDAVARSGYPVITGPSMLRIAALETMNASLENPALLLEKKIPIALGTGYESYVPKTRVILFEAGMNSTYGLGFENALRAITIEAARILKVDDRIGSIEVGKDADLALFDGNPFEYTSHVQKVLVNGRVVHSRR